MNDELYKEKVDSSEMDNYSDQGTEKVLAKRDKTSCP